MYHVCKRAWQTLSVWLPSSENILPNKNQLWNGDRAEFCSSIITDGLTFYVLITLCLHLSTQKCSSNKLLHIFREGSYPTSFQKIINRQMNICFAYSHWVIVFRLEASHCLQAYWGVFKNAPSYFYNSPCRISLWNILNFPNISSKFRLFCYDHHKWSVTCG